MKLRITLDSDLCSGSGDAFNSFIDTDIVYDRYGIPYIPAKRIKGCIREACLELVDFGVVNRNNYEKLFGKEGDSKSRFTLSDAYMAEPFAYMEMCHDLDMEEDAVLKNPQNVLNLFTYTRTQTAMIPETGVAKEKSLRTLRVVKRGLVFESELLFDGSVDHEMQEIFETSACMVTHMGINRTRGLGQVKIEISHNEKNDTKHNIIVPSKEEISAKAVDEKVKLLYTITLKSPILCRSAEGNQAKTLTYIEGSKMLGIIVGALGYERFRDLTKDNELIVANAYICFGEDPDKQKRSVPVRASLKRKKDQAFDENNEMKVIDKLYDTASDEGDPSELLSPISYEYISSNKVLCDVDTEISYHHRRPEDKSIGRATGKDDSAFYQLESISEGQTFQGFILATEKQAADICNALSSITNIRMGNGQSAEYGAVDIKLACEDVMQPVVDYIANEFTVKLNSPAIIYNKSGMLSAEDADFLDYLKILTDADDLRIVKAFPTYEKIGGFNRTWGKRKPTFTALGKGSTFLIQTITGIEPRKFMNAFIGERVSEGFGELEISTDMEVNVTLKSKKNDSKPGQDNKTNKKCNSKFINELYLQQWKKDLQEEAEQRANNIFEQNYKGKSQNNIDAAFSRFSMICKESKSFSDADDVISSIKKISTKTVAQNLLKCVNPESFDIINEKYTSWGVNFPTEMNNNYIFQISGSAFIEQFKYRLKAGN